MSRGKGNELLGVLGAGILGIATGIVASRVFDGLGALAAGLVVIVVAGAGYAALRRWKAKSATVGSGDPGAQMPERDDGKPVGT